MKKKLNVVIEFDDDNENVSHLMNAIESIFEFRPDIRREYYGGI